jgi:hypothetical protein
VKISLPSPHADCNTEGRFTYISGFLFSRGNMKDLGHPMPRSLTLLITPLGASSICGDSLWVHTGSHGKGQILLLLSLLEPGVREEPRRAGLPQSPGLLHR